MADYGEYANENLLKAPEIILFNLYIQFDGYIFKQILNNQMGGNASPFIANV